MTTILLAECWLDWELDWKFDTGESDADDIIKFCQDSKDCLQLRILNNTELENMDSQQFVNCVYFCNTETVQKHLAATGRGQYIPDTYHQRFNDFYKRNIQVMTRSELETFQEYPIFVKPRTNDKSFDGTVVTSYLDLCEIFMRYSINPLPHEQFYTCEVVKFKGEQRLLIGNGKLWGIGVNNGNYMKVNVEIDQEFLYNIVETAGNDFYVIDVALMNDKDWAIVEINPPFSFDDWGISIDVYMQYCIAACKYILNHALQ